MYRYICNKTGRRYLYLYWSLISAGPKAIILNAMETHIRGSEHVSVGFPGLLMAVSLAPVLIDTGHLRSGPTVEKGDYLFHTSDQMTDQNPVLRGYYYDRIILDKQI